MLGAEVEGLLVFLDKVEGQRGDEALVFGVVFGFPVAQLGVGFQVFGQRVVGEVGVVFSQYKCPLTHLWPLFFLRFRYNFI